MLEGSAHPVKGALEPDITALTLYHREDLLAGPQRLGLTCPPIFAHGVTAVLVRTDLVPARRLEADEPYATYLTDAYDGISFRGHC